MFAGKSQAAARGEQHRRPIPLMRLAQTARQRKSEIKYIYIYIYTYKNEKRIKIKNSQCFGQSVSPLRAAA